LELFLISCSISRVVQEKLTVSVRLRTMVQKLIEASCCLCSFVFRSSAHSAFQFPFLLFLFNSCMHSQVVHENLGHPEVHLNHACIELHVASPIEVGAEIERVQPGKRAIRSRECSRESRVAPRLLHHDVDARALLDAAVDQLHATRTNVRDGN